MLPLSDWETRLPVFRRFFGLGDTATSPALAHDIWSASPIRENP